MNLLKDFIPPLVEREKRLKNIFKGFKSFFIIIWHGISPHKPPVEALDSIKNEFLQDVKDQELDKIYQIANNMYLESKEAIKSLEEKAFKLLTYISAISAILLFYLNKEMYLGITISFLFAITLLVIAMIISLRCVGLKSQKALFLTTVFTFNADSVNPRKVKDMISDLMNYAVFNRNVANNTADILKAARHFLSLGIIITIFSLILFYTIPQNNTNNTPNNVNVTLNDTLFMKEHIDVLERQCFKLNDLQLKCDSLILLENFQYYKLDSINDQLKANI